MPEPYPCSPRRAGFLAPFLAPSAAMAGDAIGATHTAAQPSRPANRQIDAPQDLPLRADEVIR